MTDAALYPRCALPRLKDALADTPVVLVHGPRQRGKTTLARQVGDAAGYMYVSFDDDVTLAAAQADPVGFVADLPDHTVLDEVQRAPSGASSLSTLAPGVQAVSLNGTTHASSHFSEVVPVTPSKRRASRGYPSTALRVNAPIVHVHVWAHLEDLLMKADELVRQAL